MITKKFKTRYRSTTSIALALSAMTVGAPERASAYEAPGPALCPNHNTTSAHLHFIQGGMTGCGIGTPTSGSALQEATNATAQDHHVFYAVFPSKSDVVGSNRPVTFAASSMHEDENYDLVPMTRECLRSGSPTGDFSQSTSTQTAFTLLNDTSCGIKVTGAGVSYTALVARVDDQYYISHSGFSGTADAPDTTPPTVSFRDVPDAAGPRPFSLNARFDEPVEDLDDTDIAVTNGTATVRARYQLVDGLSEDYTITVTPTGGGDVTVAILGEATTDDTGNGNTASETLTIPYDSVKPVATIASSPTYGPSTHGISASVEFSEPVILEQDVSFTVTGGTAFVRSQSRNLSKKHNISISPSGPNDVTISFPADQARDEAGNFSTASEPVTIVYDDVAPVVTFDAPKYVNDWADYFVKVKLSEKIEGDLTLDKLYNTGPEIRNLIKIDDLNYTFQADAGAGGSKMTVGLPSGKVTDLAKNGNEETGLVSTFFDSVAPGAELGPVPSKVNAAPFTFTVTFAEEVTGFTDARFADMKNIELVEITGSGKTYTVKMKASGYASFRIPAGAATDLAGNPSEAIGTLFDIEYDAVTPVATIGDLPDSLDGVEPFTVTVSFDEDVTAFGGKGLLLTNATVTGVVEMSAREYRFTVTPSSPADVTVGLAQGSTGDAAGNLIVGTEPVTVFYDIVAPTVELSDIPAIVSNTDPLRFDVRFSEAVTVLEADDIVLTNATGAHVDTTNLPGLFSVRIDPTGEGDITIDIAADAVKDVAGNGSEALTQVKVVYDAVAPTVEITGLPEAVNSTEPFVITVEFSEDVTGFDADALVYGNASFVRLEKVSGSLYKVTVEPDGKGSPSVALKGDTVRDAIGNVAPGTPPVTVDYDTILPTVAFSGQPEAINGTDAFNVTVTFSEAVTGFDENALVFANASFAQYVKVSDGVYIVTVEPDGKGSPSVALKGDTVRDVAGNAVAGTDPVAVAYDTETPTVTIGDLPTATNGTDPFTVTVTFSEAVTGFDENALVFVNAGFVEYTRVSDTEYTVTVRPDGNGAPSIALKADTVQDLAGNFVDGTTPSVVAIDTILPTATIGGLPTAINGTDPFTVTVTFSEAVTGFDENALVFVNAGFVEYTRVSDTEYTVTVRPDGNGAPSIALKADTVQDLVGNFVDGTTPAVVAFDTILPTATIDGLPTATNGTDPFTVTVTFSEAVTGFDENALVFANASLVDLVKVSDTQYTVTMKPTGEGAPSVALKADTITDAAGNFVAGSTPVAVAFDTTAPTVEIDGAPSAVSTTDAFPVTFTFSEDVSGFEVADIAVANGTASNVVASDARTYTADITPTGAGDLTVAVAAAATRDAAGNDSAASAVASILYDTSMPEIVSIASERGASTDEDTLSWIVTFSKPIAGLTAGNFSLEGTTGTITSVTPVDERASVPSSSRLVRTARRVVRELFGIVPLRADASTVMAIRHRVTVSGGDLAETNGNVILSVASLATVRDGAGNAPVTTAVSGVNEAVVMVVNDTTAPTMTGLTPSTAIVTDAMAGGTFALTVTFDEPMDTTAMPTLALGSGASATLTPTTGGYMDATTFVQRYAVGNANQVLDAVDVTVSGARDVAGNTLAPAMRTGVFAIRMDAGLVAEALAKAGGEAMAETARRSMTYHRTLLQDQIRNRFARRVNGTDAALASSGFTGSGTGFYVGSDGNGIATDAAHGALPGLPSLGNMGFGNDSGVEVDMLRNNGAAVFVAGQVEAGNDTDSVYATIGADTFLGEDVLLGGTISYQTHGVERDDATLGTVAIDKTGVEGGLYLGVRLNETLSLETAAFYGRFDNDASVGDHDGSFDSDRLSGFMQGTMRHDMSGVSLVTAIGASGIRETADGYVTDRGATVAEDTLEQFDLYLDQGIEFGRIQVGTHSLGFDGGITAGYRHRSLDSDGLDESGLALDLRIGLSGSVPIERGSIAYHLRAGANDVSEEASYFLGGGIGATIDLSKRSTLSYGLNGTVDDVQEEPNPGLKASMQLTF